MEGVCAGTTIATAQASSTRATETWRRGSRRVDHRYPALENGICRVLPAFADYDDGAVLPTDARR